MRLAMGLFEIRPALAPRAVLAGMLMLLLRSMAENRSFSDEPPPINWLKLNEDGEPCEVTLVDGTVMKLDTYGDEYQAFRPVAPVDGVKQARAIVDYERDGLGRNWGCHSLQLDVEGRKMYWIEVGVRSQWNICSAGLNGESPRRIVKLDDQHPLGLAVDRKQRKIYWRSVAGKTAAFGKPPEARRAIWRANLDGSNPDPLFSGLKQPGAIAIDRETGEVFYFDDLRLARGNPDGTNEAVVIDKLELPYTHYLRAYRGSYAVIDREHRKIYWSEAGQGSFIARANLDGTAFEVIFNEGGHIHGLGLDLENDKIYWAEAGNGEIWRGNLDGSQRELIAFGMSGPGGVDVDSEHGFVYWTDRKIVGVDSYGLVRKLKLPSMPMMETKPAAPQITSIEPARQRANGNVVVYGKHLTGVKNVRLVEDNGQQTDAKFKLTSDSELTLIVPPAKGVKKAAIVLQGPGGVTVTIPRDTSIVKRGDRDFTNYDRSQDDAKFCFVVSPGAWFTRVEQSLLYVPAGARALPGGRGNVVLFLKDGSASGAGDAKGVIIYHEPFARITGRAKVQGDHEYIPVPAIRPSFVESLFEYEE